MLLQISAFCMFLLTIQVSNIEKMSGSYLGQEPPGNTPVRFARDIIPDDLHSVPVFSKDGRTMYLKSMNGEGIIMSIEKGNNWTSPAPIQLDNSVDNSDDPCLSPSGDKLFFSSYDKESNRDYIYFCELQHGDLGDPQQPNGNLNTIDMHWQFSMADNGNIYYSANGNIYCSELVADTYMDPYRLDTCINTRLSECTPYVSPDEDILIFARSSEGKPDLFISRKDHDGNWKTAKPLLHGISSEHHEMCPRITADGRYLFFISSREGLFSAYWVNAKILDEY